MNIRQAYIRRGMLFNGKLICLLISVQLYLGVRFNVPKIHQSPIPATATAPALAPVPRAKAGQVNNGNQNRSDLGQDWTWGCMLRCCCHAPLATFVGSVCQLKQRGREAGRHANPVKTLTSRRH